MVRVEVTVHKRGLHPFEAVKAWHKHQHEDMSIDAILAEGDVQNMKMELPSRKAIWSAIHRVDQMSAGDLVPQSRYGSCGRRRSLTDGDVERIVAFVKAWCNKRFCTCNHIKHGLDNHRQDHQQCPG